LLVALALYAPGCAVGPNFVPPKPPLTNAYTPEGTPAQTATADGRAQRFEPAGELPLAWWRTFHCPELDGRVDEAIAANPSLRAAQASLRQSEDELRAGYGVFFPQADLGAGATREAPFVPVVGVGKPTLNVFTLSGAVSYVLDVFGGERRTVEGQRAQVDVQRYETAATYLTLVGNTVNATISEAGYQAQVEATQKLIAELSDQVYITETQARAGTVAYVSVLALQTQLAATEAQLPALEQRLTQSRHLVAALVGQEPAAWNPPSVELTSIEVPGDVPLTLPSELVHERPDILAAEAQLHRASAEIGVATAAMFPQITLSGNYGWTATTTAALFSGPGAVWAVGADLATPLFHGGALWFQRRAAIDAYEQALASYRQTVLSGLEQVADALRALVHDAAQVEAQSRQEEAASETLRLTEANYRAGLANYLEVLIADVQKNQATITRIGGQAQRLQDTAALFVALGGRSWAAEELTRRDS